MGQVNKLHVGLAVILIAIVNLVFHGEGAAYMTSAIILGVGLVCWHFLDRTRPK